MYYHDHGFKNLMAIVKENKIAENRTLLEKTFCLMKKHYKGKKRLSEKPFLNHLINTAYILAEKNLDEETIAAGLAHDFLDNNLGNKTILEKETGANVAKIVEEITIIDQIVLKNRGIIPIKNLSDCVLASAKDVRTLIVQLAATLDNLRNMGILGKKEQVEKAEDAQELYVPIAHKLGLYAIEWEINDLCFKIMDEKEYYAIKKELNEKRNEREKIIEMFIQEIKQKFGEKNVNATIYGRPKSFYSIYKKMQKSNKKLNEIMDLLGIRILCDTVEECYSILGIVHANYNLLPHHFDDYLANPKPNGYHSLHTVIEWGKRNIEIQIRTYDMHYEAEEGIAAHWQYKEFQGNPYFDKKLSWAKQLVNWQQKNPSLLRNFQVDLGENRIFTFTPKKKLIILPEKSTPVDFAFAVHTQLGLLCKKALVNGKTITLDKELQNGDTIEIIKDANPQVKKSWLSFAKTEKAKEKIRKKLGIPQKSQKANIKVKKREEGKILLAKCCNPLPGDEVIGYRTTKRKIIIHKTDCINKKNLKKENIIEMTLGEKKENYTTKISITATQGPKVLERILKTLTQEQITIKSTRAEYDKSNIMTTEFEIVIKSVSQLNKLIAKLRRTPGIIEIKRI